MIDTLAIAKRLRATKLDPADAETIAEAIALGAGDAQAHLATKPDLTELRGELKTDLAELRTELKTDIAELRGELKADVAELRTELKADIAELRGETEKGFAELRGETEKGFAELRGEQTLIRWMLGFTLALNVAILLRLLLH